MCGIIAVLRSKGSRAVPNGADLLERLDRAVASLESAAGERTTMAELVLAAANEVGSVDAELHGLPGVQALLQQADLGDGIETRVDAVASRSASLEKALDAGEITLSGDDLERVNAAVLALKDAVWAIARDRLRTARAVGDFAGSDTGDAAVGGYLSIQLALSAIDRLEVRGRDSAGLHVLVDGHGLDLSAPDVAGELSRRKGPLFNDGEVRGLQDRAQA